MAKSDASSLQRLKEEQERALIQTDNQLGQWKQFRSDYVALRDRLKTLPHKTVHNVMVPFGSLAFMPGQLVHTNELLVLLGENYFMECSAMQAADIVTRRLKGLDENIHAIQKQREMLVPRTHFTSEMVQMAAGEGNELEIREEYDDERERLWRERHRESLRREGQRQMKEAAKKGSETAALSAKTDTDYWDILDQLEQQENEKEELDDSEEEEESGKTDDADQSVTDEEDDQEEEDSSDDEENDIADCLRKITFSHSKQEADQSTSVEPAAKSADGTDAINSPADIYRLVQMPPRSILKTPTPDHTASRGKGARRASQNKERRVSFGKEMEDGRKVQEQVNVSGREKRKAGGHSDDDDDDDEETWPDSFGHQTRVQAYSHTVVERQLPAQYNQQPERSETSSSPASKPESNTASSRPMSRFRAAKEKTSMSADSQGAMGSDASASADSQQGCDVRSAARPVSKFRASRMKQGGGS